MTQFNLTPYREQIAQLLIEQGNIYRQLNSTLGEAMCYAIEPNGKLLRPLLCLSIPIDLQLDYTLSLMPSIAIELIHCYSLIHDDLPCMDDDNYRRGKLSCHKVFGEAHALLAGNALLTQAFSTLVHSPKPEQIKIQMIQLLVSHSGALGMLGGQAMELESSNKSKDLKTINQLKTGKLFSLCIELAIVTHEIPTHLSTPLREVIQIAGEAFQLIDDNLDEKEDTQKITNFKSTSISQIKKMHDETQLLLNSTKTNWPMLNTLLDSMFFRAE